MGYYLDLHFRDEKRRYSVDELVSMFYEQGCKPVSFSSNPEWVEVYYHNEEYSEVMLIHFIDIKKHPEERSFADVRLSWATNFNGFVNIVKSLIMLGEVFDFYVYDTILKTEINLENVELVAEKVVGVARNIVGGIGRIT